jgi:MoxR-like ATPase
MNEKETLSRLDRLASLNERIRAEMAKVIVGQERVIEEILIALFSGGHCLIEGVPGLAKTLMVSTLARILDLQFNRIQFTPDLMPSDITGADILAENKTDGRRYFEYIKGPIFANILLADEINRTPPKTQAALLQAMQEYQVTAGNHTFEMDRPFLVLATQNPIEQEGTYPLPEAQLDRFMFKVFIDYPNETEEKQIVRQHTIDTTVNKVVDKADILALQEAVKAIPVSDHVLDFAVKLARSTRPADPSAPEFIRRLVTWGAGPRASQFMILAARTRAALQGRPTPSVDDVKRVAPIVLQHRVLMSFAAEAEGMRSVDVVTRLMNELTAK